MTTQTEAIRLINQLKLKRAEVAEILDVTPNTVSRKKNNLQNCYFSKNDIKMLKQYKKEYIQKLKK